MPTSLDSIASSPLVAVPLGTTCEIRRFRARAVRARCLALGIHAGDVVTCVGHGPTEVVLETSAGARVEIDWFYACFVEVGPAPARPTMRAPSRWAMVS